jgi:hypothetical protein
MEAGGTKQRMQPFVLYSVYRSSYCLFPSALLIRTRPSNFTFFVYARYHGVPAVT